MSSPSQVVERASALRSPSEEFVDALTHGIGLMLSIAGATALLPAAWLGGDGWSLVGCGFYAATLVAVYAFSTLSHLDLPEHLNQLFRRLDQGCIYLLIVGTFTPFALMHLRTPGWTMFYALILAAAVGGCLSKTVFTHRLNGISVWLYLALGWAQALAVWPLWQRIPPMAMAWVVAGGVCYTVGTVFLMLDVRRYHFHSIWHVLVIAGSGCHYVAIWQSLTGVTG